MHLHLRVLQTRHNSTCPFISNIKEVKTKRCSSLKEGCDPQSKLDRRHQLLKINAVDIEGLGRSIHWSSWGSINWLGLVWGTYPSLPAGCTWEQSCSSASIFAPQTSISELVFSLLDILMPTLQGGHHQLILLTQGSSSISGLLSKWDVIEKQRLEAQFSIQLTCTPILNLAIFI